MASCSPDTADITMETDPHKILGVVKGEPVDEIRKQYRCLCLKYHPYIHCDDSEFRKLHNAYLKLTDEYVSVELNFIAFFEKAFPDMPPPRLAVLGVSSDELRLGASKELKVRKARLQVDVKKGSAYDDKVHVQANGIDYIVTFRPDWQVNVGFLSFGSGGLQIKPQYKFGVRRGRAYTDLGLSDIRDGLKVSAEKGVVAATLNSSGQSISELHESIRYNVFGLAGALGGAQLVLENNVEQLAIALGVSGAQLARTFAGDCASSRQDPMTLKIDLDMALGASVHACLGWRDTNGYRMFGFGLSKSLVVRFGANMFVGWHTSRKFAKIIIGIYNFKLEYVFPLQVAADVETA